MIKRIGMAVAAGLLMASMLWAAPAAKIISLKGEVKVRRGVEENWQPARVGMLLETIDTILTFENGEVVLEMPTGENFRLSGNTWLELSDLRTISERELFLALMSQKISKIPAPAEKTRLRIGNVSAVHGEQKTAAPAPSAAAETVRWRREVNGANALLAQRYFPNAILRLHQIMARYPEVVDCGEMQFSLGQAFEALQRTGQAHDAYQAAVAQGQGAACEAEAAARTRVAQEKLKQLSN